MALDLFGTKARKAEEEAREKAYKVAEDEVMQKLSQVQLLDLLVENVRNNDEDWVTKCQSYYDSRVRVVNIEEDMFEIKWRRVYQERVQVGTYQDGTPKIETRDAEEVFGRVGYSYTKSGYRPLHSYDNGIPGGTVSSDRVCQLWTKVVHERLQAAMPNCEFSKVNGCSFTYQVPALTWEDWF